MPYPINFFHIGLPKCGSTYLQTIWQLDAHRNIFLSPAVEIARKKAMLGEYYYMDFPKFSFDLGHSSEGYTVGSSEGFTWAYLGEPDKYQYLPYLHMASAKILGEPNLTDRILIIVRDPIHWIRSAHEQSIKEGNFLDMTDYLSTASSFVEGVLNLEFIIECWSKYFEKIVVLPLEWLTQDEEKFWSIYENELGVKAPSSEVIQQVNAEKAYRNASVRSRLPALAMLNMLRIKMMDTYQNMLDDCPNEVVEEYRQFKNVWFINMWVNRRITEFSSDDDFVSVISNLKVPSLETFQNIELTQELSEFLEQKYISIIEKYDYIDKELIQSYRDSLAKCS